MKLARDLVMPAIALILISVLVCLVTWRIYGKPEEIAFWLLMETAFLPIQVLLVGLIIERLLARHARRERLHKMNMVIGTFFSELGTGLLGDLAVSLENRPEILPALAVRGDWTAADFRKAIEHAAMVEWRVSAERLDLAALRARLAAKRDLLVLLLANPNLLEHERFTDLLWAVFHLMEELAVRPSLENLPKTDLEHLAGDAKRVCLHLAGEWLRYCRHLQQTYPYVFSLMVRTHPLQPHPSPTVK
jgi:hypothetical protein